MSNVQSSQGQWLWLQSIIWQARFNFNFFFRGLYFCDPVSGSIWGVFITNLSSQLIGWSLYETRKRRRTRVSVVLIIHGMHSAESRQKRMDVNGGPSLLSWRCLISTFKYSLWKYQVQFPFIFLLGFCFQYMRFLFLEYRICPLVCKWAIRVVSPVCIFMAHKVLHVAKSNWRASTSFVQLRTHPSLGFRVLLGKACTIRW